MPTSLHHVCTICLVHAPQHVARWWGRASATESAHAHGRPYACITTGVRRWKCVEIGAWVYFFVEYGKREKDNGTPAQIQCSSGTQRHRTPRRHHTRLFLIWHKAHDIDMAAKRWFSRTQFAYMCTSKVVRATAPSDSNGTVLRACSCSCRYS